MALLSYIVKRLIFLVFIIIGITLLTFTVSHTIPADPTLAFLGETAQQDPEIVAAFRAKWGLDQPLPQQYLTYISNLFLKGDFGLSIRSQRSVTEDLKAYFPATLELALFAAIVASTLGVIFGVIAALYRNKWIDQLLRAVSVIGVSVPVYWLALIAIYIFYFKLGWAPSPGRLSMSMTAPETITGMYLLDSLLTGNWPAFKDAFSHILLPGLVLGSAQLGLIIRTTRTSMLEVLGEDYIRTARSKGLYERIVNFKHALGNALIPTITVIGIGFGNLLGGSVLVEQMTSWPGVGRYAYQATTGMDFQAIMGVTVLIAINFVLINLVVDVLYGFLDPRVRLE